MNTEIRSDLHGANEQTHRAWEANAEYWDTRMGEGNDFVRLLIRPATERLLDIQPGEIVLDAACGNGLAARRLAEAGARVVAFDFSSELIRRARQRTTDHQDRIEWHVADATDGTQLAALGEPHGFDAVLCNMALFDIADIRPLAHALGDLLRPGGRFVFSVIHPCFNNPNAIQFAERADRGGQVSTTWGMKITGYMSSVTAEQAAIPGQPEPQLIFHRPLEELLGTFLREGFVLDALEERAFPQEPADEKGVLGWNGHLSEIPPVLVVRMRAPEK